VRAVYKHDSIIPLLTTIEIPFFLVLVNITGAKLVQPTHGGSGMILSNVQGRHIHWRNRDDGRFVECYCDSSVRVNLAPCIVGDLAAGGVTLATNQFFKFSVVHCWGFLGYDVSLPDLSALSSGKFIPAKVAARVLGLPKWQAFVSVKIRQIGRPGQCPRPDPSNPADPSRRCDLTNPPT
jgi:hypothetical protein